MSALVKFNPVPPAFNEIKNTLVLSVLNLFTSSCLLDDFTDPSK